MVERPGAPTPTRRTHRPVAGAVAAAGDVCRERGVQLTGIRRAVLEALHRADRPLGAYEIVARLAADLGHGPKPQSVYRCLDFLMAQGFVSRLESWNAYVPHADPGAPHAEMFLLCDRCGSTTALPCPDLDALIGRNAATVGFLIGRRVLEVRGLCATCADTAAGGTS